MPDLLRTAAAWLSATLETNVSETIGYTRGALGVVGGLLATIGHTPFSQVTDSGIIETYQTRDYLITAAELILGGNVVLPQRGDLITETDANGNSFVYQVMAPGGEPHYRFCDQFRVKLRVHTKQVQ